MKKKDLKNNNENNRKMKYYILGILGVCVLAAVIVVIVITQNKNGSDTEVSPSPDLVIAHDADGQAKDIPDKTSSEDGSNPVKDESDVKNHPDENDNRDVKNHPDENDNPDVKDNSDENDNPDESDEPDEDSWIYRDELGAPSALPEAGTYILLAQTSKQAALRLPKETALQMKEKALAYYKKAGSFKGIVMEEDGTGICYGDNEYAPLMIEDGYIYTPEYGRVYASYGTIFTYGVKNRERYWYVCYRLTPEETASLPAPTQHECQCTDFSKIRVDTLDQYIALNSIFSRAESEGGNIREYFDEAYNTVLEISEKEAAETLEGEEKRKALDEANKDISVNDRMLFSEKQVTMARVMELNGGTVPIDIDNGKVTFIGGTCTDKPIENEYDAYGVLESITDLLGGDENTEYEYFTTNKDLRGYSYYTFVQMHDLKTVPGGAAKIIVDPDNKMRAVTSTLIGGEYAGPSMIKAMDPIGLKEIVLNQKQFPKEELLFYEEYTEKTLLPVVLNPFLSIDVDINPEQEKTWFVWVVYTNNPESGSAGKDRYPYLAHYITQDGEYLYNLPVMEIGDEAAHTGFSTAYVFTDMEDEKWTGTVKYFDGHEETITVPVMKDPENGMYYLGDKTRRIAFADCYEFLYNGFNVDMVSSKTNDDWDNYFLILYKNIISVWDYYEAFGWRSTNGKGSPILVLMDFCDQDHNQIDNACYAGYAHGWEIFGFAATNIYGMAPDIVAHEFTHGYSVNSASYFFLENDSGAINEALSDIMGNIFESIIEQGDTDPNWLIGEDIDLVLRNMSDPHKYGQPQYIWDRNYFPNVKYVKNMNDKGGIHYNASLLSRIAYRLCKETSMSLYEAYRYWSCLIYSIVPATDFKQLSVLLPWIMDETGMSQYTDDLKKYIKEARLSDKTIPEELEEGTSMIVFELPDEEIFKDGNWVIYLYDAEMQYDPDYVFEKEDLSMEYKSRDDMEMPDPIIVVPSVTYFGVTGKDGRTIRIVLSNSLPKSIILYHFKNDTDYSDKTYIYKHEKWVEYTDNITAQYIVIPDGYYYLSSEGLEGISPD